MDLWDKRDDMVVHEREPFNAEPPPTALADHLITPLDTFYSRNHGPIPDIAPAAWRLTVDGLVERPMELSLAGLRDRFEEIEVTATLQCAGNRRAGLIEVRDIPGEDPWGPGATSTARWSGVRLADVLAEAGLKDNASDIALSAPDFSQLADPAQSYGSSIPTGKANGPEVLLAWAMDGEPLTRVHGAPLRAVVPGWIGARSVKWLTRITAQNGPSDNYFQATAYRILPSWADLEKSGPGDGIPLGPLALNCDILRPGNDSHLRPGPTEISGYALAGDDRTVARVDVSLDGGNSWAEADLDAGENPWAWQLWRITVDLPAGEVDITARAWDSTGAPQPESPVQLWNPKGYVNNSWARIHLSCG